MKCHALIGYGIDYTRSPFVHGEICRLADAPAFYDIFDFPPSELPERAAYLRQYCDGFNVTKPYKTEIIRYLDKLDPSAAAAGAVNTVSRAADGRLIGHNTDAAGFWDGLIYHSIRLQGRAALILGAGGGARAVAEALRKKCSALMIYNRTYEKAVQVAAELKGGNITATRELPKGGFYAVVNCTSAGLRAGESPALPDFDFRSCKAAVDIIYNPRETVFLSLARQSGLKTANGAAMLFYQALRAENLWQGITLSEDKVRGVIEAI
ncbi:MAG: shikimate dehydrogenase [Clostridiales bacterium]|jgi:shikimate dehydrogenase|nr:shikimate dehydrogenase [Clostridiales bacterium]